MKKFYILTILFAYGLIANALEYITVGGLQRSMIVYAPKNLPTSPALVISMHGASQDAAYQKEHAQWELVADTAKFVVVYPNGIDNSWDLSGTKDLNFLEAVIDLMHQRYNVNKNRVYLNGFSMGGMMTYYAAMARPNVYAAFAPVSGYNIGGTAYCSRAVPIIHTHGTADDVCGYSAGEAYVKKWITIDGCNTTAEVISPYPKSKPNSCATLYKWTGGKNGTEVWLLSLKDKGHWYSMDGVISVYTSVEVWNFCKRYSLGPEAPDMTTVEPEDNSFDLPAETSRTYKIGFSKKIIPSKSTAQFVSSSKTVNMEPSCSEDSMTLILTVPQGETLTDGLYTLTIKNITSTDGGVLPSLKFSYTIGFTEVTEHVTLDTLYLQNWYDMKNDIGEGIPWGWKRVNSNTDGTKDEKGSGEANTGGSRMKYFNQGGDFDAGWYISAREYEVCNLYYGQYPNYKLHFTPGKYRLTFNSTYWTQGASNNGDTYSMTIYDSKNTVVLTESSLASTGCVAENTAQTISGSQAHSKEFSITQEGDYVLNFAYSAGWNGIILGNIMITTAATTAEVYKSAFLKAYNDAKQLLEDAADMPKMYPITSRLYKNLKTVVDKYTGFASTSPTEYQNATTAIIEAYEQVKKYWKTLGVEETEVKSEESEVRNYNLAGQVVGEDYKGIVIRNNKKHLVK